MVKARICADGRLYIRYGVDESLRLIARHDRPHKGAGVHRRKIFSAADERAQVVIELVAVRRAGQRRDTFNRTDAVLSVNNFFSDRKHPNYLPSYYSYLYITNFQ